MPAPWARTVAFAAVFTTACASAGGPSTRDPAMPAAGSAEPRELLPDEQVQHVLSRLAYGARPGEAAAVRAVGVDQWIERQLQPEKIEDTHATVLVARYAAMSTNRSDLVRMFTEQREMERRSNGQQQPLDPMIRRAVPDLQASLLTRAVASERQLYEVMVNFWHNHFSVYAQKAQQERLFLIEYDRDVIRPHAMGKFRDLLGAVAKSPAMLFYLDNWQSQADSAHQSLADLRESRLPGRRRTLLPRRPRRGLNENYARELMELHTLGVDGGYTQKDVQELARVLTGWTIAIPLGGGFIFRPEMHDADHKVVLGKQFVSGRGIEEGEAALDLLARHPSTARYITTKVARHFISDDPPAAVVDRCSAVFARTDGDIRETLRCVITGPEFFSKAAYRAKVKTPFQVVASAMRALNAIPDQTPRSVQAVAQLGQPIFGRQTPDGWPDRAEALMNTGAILNRINFGLTIASGRMPGVTFGRVAEIEALRAAPRETQVDGIARLLFGGQVSADTREVLRTGANPLAGETARQQLTGLEQIVGLALGAPEFQRR